MNLTCLVVDDEHLARRGMERFIQKKTGLELHKSCDSAFMALEILQKEPVDILFLDIHMPGMNGLSMLKKLGSKPVTIITTAYPNHALEGFDLDVMDYLVKPIPYPRFEKAVDKAREFIELKNAQKRGTTGYFFIKCENRYEKINYDDLLYVEAMQNYVIVHTDSGKHISYLTLKSVEEYLPSNKFLKVQKSYIVSLGKIESIDGHTIKIKDKSIGISRKNKEEIVEAILGNNLLKR